MAADRSQGVAKLVALLTAAAAATLVVALVVTTTHTVHRTVLSPMYTKNTHPTEKWNGLPEGYKFHPFIDMEHTDDWTTEDPWSSEGQYGLWQGIQANTINDFGCGPHGPLDCSVGTVPEQHWANSKRTTGLKQVKKIGLKAKAAKEEAKGKIVAAKAKQTKLSPMYTKDTHPTEKWNGLPEGFHFHPFIDLEHTDDWTTAEPFSSKGQFGMWQGIQEDTINDYGCGPDGPMDCNVGTSPSQHWANGGRAFKNGMMKRQMSLQGNLKWNGLPENYHNDPFGENPAEQTSPDPWGSQGQYGMWQGIQADTINDYGCGPYGPINCQVGTTPEQHWAVVPVMEYPSLSPPNRIRK